MHGQLHNDSPESESGLGLAERLQSIRQGFEVKYLCMRDGETGEMLWECADWDNTAEEVVASIPARILRCKSVSREIMFSSTETIGKLSLKQKVLLMGEPIEQWDFDFGFVMPNSTNSWQQTIEAAEESEIIPADVLSGNLVIETRFLDGKDEISVTKVKVMYV